MNREQYHAALTMKEYHSLGLRGIPYTREEYLAEQLERVNSEVSSCPGGKYSLMGAMPCDLCGIDTPRYTS